MRRILCALVFFLGSIQSPAQTATDTNEGSRLEYDSINQVYRFKWWGRAGSTYFIQHSDNLLEPWQWLPIVESGDDSIKEWGFTTTGDKFFARLKYWTGPTTDPEGDDFDQDGVPNLYEVQHGNSPFGIEDSDSDGLPDGWLDVHANTFAIYPPTRLNATLSRDQTAPGNIYLNNDTDTPVTYSVTVSGNSGPSYALEDSISGNAVYQWNDISSTGTRLNTISNAASGHEAVTLAGFAFPYFGQNYSQVAVSVNGLLTFGTPAADDENSPVPSYGAAPSNLIAPLWDNLETTTSGDIYYKEETNRLIVQYQNVTCAYQAGTFTFQVILNANGTIEFQYNSLAGPTNQCTVGIEDATRTLGLQAAFNEPYLAGSMAVIFHPTAQFFTLSPITGTVSPRTRTTLAGTFRSLQLPFGTYTANVSVTHNGGTPSPVNIAANLTVNNVPMEIALVSPTSQDTIFDGQPVDLIATVTDVDSPITKVEFFDNGTKVGEDLEAPYQLEWMPSGVGAHSLTASATDVYDVTVTSSVKSVQVRPDADHDLMDDSWETQYGLDATRNDAMEDHDGDRIPNVFEYYRGGLPNDSVSVPPADFIVDPANQGTEDYIFATIQEAITAARQSTFSNGQQEYPNAYAVIEVRAGVYAEQVVLGDIPIALLAVLGSTQGPVEIRSPAGAAVSITAPAAIDGFVITHADGAAGSGVTASADSVALTNCLIKGNKAEAGGGIDNDGSLRLVHCTVFGNQATNAGRAICNTGTIRLVNSIIWGNGGAAPEEIYQETGSPEVVTSLIAGGEFGGMAVNPLLTPQGYLKAGSPAIGVAAVAGTTYDLHGQTRDATPDIGAEEWKDSNSDGYPDWYENAFGAATANPDGDGLNNAAEFQAGTNPLLGDSDGDGLADNWEIQHGLDPLDKDQNHNGVLDGSDDFDGDGRTNAQEIADATDPFDPASVSIPPNSEADTGSANGLKVYTLLLP